jgi:hypothetical protein
MILFFNQSKGMSFNPLLAPCPCTPLVVPIEVRDEFIRFVHEYLKMLLSEITQDYKMMHQNYEDVDDINTKASVWEIYLPAVDDALLGTFLHTLINTMMADNFSQEIDIEDEWLSRIDVMLRTLEKINSICNYFLQNERGDVFTMRYDALKNDVANLHDSAVNMYDRFAFFKANYPDYNSILLNFAHSVNPYLFWKCFWREGNQFITDNTGYEMDGLRKNNLKIEFLKLIEDTIQFLLSQSPEQYVFCRDSLQDLLDDNTGWKKSIDKMEKLFDNPSFAYALEITGIEIVPRPSSLTQGTLSMMHNVPFQRQLNEVYMPLPPFSD